MNDKLSSIYVVSAIVLAILLVCAVTCGNAYAVQDGTGDDVLPGDVKIKADKALDFGDEYFSCQYVTANDRFECELTAAGKALVLTTGNFIVGDYSPVNVGDGDDLAIGGALEVAGYFYFLGGYFDTGTVDRVIFKTNGMEKKIATAPLSAVSATAFQTAFPFSNLVSTGLEAGQAHEGSTEGYVGVGDAADVLRIGFTVPELCAVGNDGDLILEFDLHEQAAEELNVDVVIYEYGETVPIVTDTLTVADATPRGIVGLDTLNLGIGDLVEIGKFYLIEVTATADTDDFNLYGVRAKYRTAIQNNL